MRLVVGALVVAVTMPVTLTAMGPTAVADGSSATTASTALPFAMPPAGVLRSSPRKAFAHYVPSLPLSLDNQPATRDYYQRNYLTPTGEGGRHAAIGGFLRDRPLPRPVRPEAHWRLLDMESEVRSAIAAGLDGFTVVLYTLGDVPNRQWDNIKLLMQAASNVDPAFKVIPQPDVSSWSNIANRTPATFAKYLAELLSYRSAYRLSDGRYVLSAFTAERKSVAWWTQVLSILKTTYGKPIAFFPVLQNEMVHARAFAPISYAIGNWGVRNPKWNDPLVTYRTGPMGRIAGVHALGRKWMQPISVQDQRPREGIFEEAHNTTNLRNTWTLAIQGGAEFVHYTTWGDYPEGTVMAPTAKHGWSFLDISAYYLTKWKTGRAPAIIRDTVYLTHRTQFAAARPSFRQRKLMRPRAGTIAPRDSIEALTFLTAPGTVSINVGGRTRSCAVDAGVDTCTVPLGIGTPSATVRRGGATVASVTSPYRVTATPHVQDLQYVAASSARQGMSTSPAGAAVPRGVTTKVTGSDVTVSWTASTDNVAVTGYDVHRSATSGFTPSATTRVGSVTGTSYTNTSVPTGTWYYRVIAKDAAGNHSPPSAQASATVASSSTPTTVTVTPKADTYANQGAASANYGTSSSLASRGSPGYVSYLRFAVPAAPSGQTLTRAVLRIRTTSESFAGSPDAQTVQLAYDTWSESSLTWNNRPALFGSALGTITGGTASSKVYEASLSVADLQTLVGKQGTVAVTSAGGDSFWFWSSNHAATSYRPQLVLTYS